MIQFFISILISHATKKIQLFFYDRAFSIGTITTRIFIFLFTAVSRTKLLKEKTYFCFRCVLNIFKIFLENPCTSLSMLYVHCTLYINYFKTEQVTTYSTFSSLWVLEFGCVLLSLVTCDNIRKRNK